MAICPACRRRAEQVSNNVGTVLTQNKNNVSEVQLDVLNERHEDQGCTKSLSVVYSLASRSGWVGGTLLVNQLPTYFPTLLRSSSKTY